MVWFIRGQFLRPMFFEGFTLPPASACLVMENAPSVFVLFWSKMDRLDPNYLATAQYCCAPQIPRLQQELLVAIICWILISKAIIIRKWFLTRRVNCSGKSSLVIHWFCFHCFLNVMPVNKWITTEFKSCYYSSILIKLRSCCLSQDDNIVFHRRW